MSLLGRSPYISGPLWKKDAQERLNGHKQALAEHDIEFNENSLYEGDFIEDSGYEGFTALYKKIPPLPP